MTTNTDTMFARTQISKPKPSRLQQVLDDPRVQGSRYREDLVLGYQRLSGADLKGKARKYGSWYAQQRKLVCNVAAEYGIVARYDADQHGLLVWHDTDDDYQWWKIALPGGQPMYGYGLRREALEYAARISERGRGEPGTVYYADSVTPTEAAELEAGDEGFPIDDSLRALDEEVAS